MVATKVVSGMMILNKLADTCLLWIVSGLFLFGAIRAWCICQIPIA